MREQSQYHTLECPVGLIRVPFCPGCVQVLKGESQSMNGSEPIFRNEISAAGLLESADIFTAAFHAMVQQVFIYNTGGRVIWANPAARACLGTEPVGLTMDEMLDAASISAPEGPRLLREELPEHRALQGVATAGISLYITTAPGNKTAVLASASPIRKSSSIIGAIVLWQDVTGQKEAFRRLQDEQAVLRAIIASAPEAIVVADEQARVTLTNPVADRFYTPSASLGEEVEARTMLQLCYPDGTPYDPRDLPLTRSAWHGEICTSIEMTIVDPDGRCHDLLVSSAPIRDDTGKASGAVGVLKDITEIRRAEREREHLLARVEAANRELHRQTEELRRVSAELEDQKKKYEHILSSLPDCISIFDREGRYIYVNPTASVRTGCLPEGPIGRTWQELGLSPEVMAPIETGIRSVFATGTAMQGEAVYASGDRTEYRHYIISPVFGPDGSVEAVVTSSRDITERKAAEAKVESRNHQLSVLNRIIRASASSLSIAELLETSLEKTLEVMDFDCGLVYMLDAERKRAILQYQQEIPGEYLARDRMIRVHHWPYNYIFIAGQPRYFERAATSALSSMEDSLLNDLGVSALACIPLVAESVVVGAIFIGSKSGQVFSPEERTLLEAIGNEIGSGILRGMLYRRLEAANREANLYLDIMTHDIKNAENVSSLYADLLIDILDGEAEEYVKKLRGSIRKSAGIIKDVSTIRRIHHEPGELVPVCLDDVIKEEIERMPETVILFDGARQAVLADYLLSEIFTNLIGNSIKFGGPDVEITIRVEDYYDDNAVLVSVEDTGPGIPDALKKTVLNRFEQGRREGSGEGLGLYIVKTLVERYGGRIWVEHRVCGRPELGAAFRFTLQEAGAGDAAEPEEEDDE